MKFSDVANKLTTELDMTVFLWCVQIELKVQELHFNEVVAFSDRRYKMRRPNLNLFIALEGCNPYPYMGRVSSIPGNNCSEEALNTFSQTRYLCHLL
jgi:hypothetical protein